MYIDLRVILDIFVCDLFLALGYQVTLAPFDLGYFDLKLLQILFDASSHDDNWMS
jgi:hypothetical protein